MMWLSQSWLKVRSSFWFLPGLIVLVAVALAVVLIESEAWFGAELFERWPRLFGSGASGARGLLGTVASSMITVAGVVFSITVVVLSLASSQYTSRVLRNFMVDRVNQAVLGIFLGIFAYCLVVLRTIRGAEEGGFVPPLAVLFGLLLAFVGIAMLIYFIHHISVTIQATHILAAVADETVQVIDRQFPEGTDESDADPPARPDSPQYVWHHIASAKSGYVQNVDTAGLVALAAERKTVLWLERGVGQFVTEGAPMAHVSGGVLDDDDTARLRALYAIGRQRTVEQDAAFGIRQIVDVALKGLSPGINDTTTAIMCIDYLTAILFRLADRRIETRYRDEEGQLRLLTRGPTYAALVGGALDQVRQNAEGNVAVLERLLGSLEQLAAATIWAPRRRVLAEHARAVLELARRSVPAARDRQVIEECWARVSRLLPAAGDA
jgi:uncharacterized membrane protein